MGSTLWLHVVNFDNQLIIWAHMSWWPDCITNYRPLHGFRGKKGQGPKCTCINARRRNRSARQDNTLWPIGKVAMPPRTPASSVTKVQGWSRWGQAQRFFALTASAASQRQWTKMRGVLRWRSYRSGTSYSFAAWVSGERAVGRRQMDGVSAGRWETEVFTLQQFSLRFFTKWAEQKAKVRFL